LVINIVILPVLIGGESLSAQLGGKFKKKLLAACEASPCKLLVPAVRIALETAMRQGEILALTWPQINLKRRFAKLKDTKNGEDRNVPLSPQAVAVFKEMLSAHGEEVEVLPRGPVFRKRLLTATGYGMAIS
jgi:integrase